MNVSYQGNERSIIKREINVCQPFTRPGNDKEIKDAPTVIVVEWGFWIKFVATPIIVLVGIIGNILSVVVMRTKTLRHKSYSIYLCTLAIFDTGTLIFRQLESVDEYLVSHKALPGVFQGFNKIGCKIYNVLSHVTTLMCAWLVVLMAFERLMAVCFPFKNTVLRKQNGAPIVIGALLGLALISQSFRFVMIDHIMYDPENNIWDCLAGINYVTIYTSLNVYFFQWTLIFVLPVFCILACNSLVLCRIFMIKRELQNKEKGLDNRYKRTWNKKNRSTCMLLTVTFTYILTLLPLFTLTLIVDLTIKLGDIKTARETFFALSPYIDLCVPISLLNYAVNFFIYILSGKRFRFELVRSLARSLAGKRVSRRSYTGTGTGRITREELLRQ